LDTGARCEPHIWAYIRRTTAFFNSELLKDPSPVLPMRMGRRVEDRGRVYKNIFCSENDNKVY
jgi:hypothetical protein